MNLFYRLKRTAAILSLFILLCLLGLPSDSAWAARGVIPNRSYLPSQVFKKISPAMSAAHHNQSHVVDGYVVIGGNGRHEVWDISNPFRPVKKSEFLSPHRFGEAESHTLSFMQKGTSRYAVTISGRGIDIWNITNLLRPVLLRALVLQGIHYGDRTNAVWGVYWQGQYIYVGGTNTGLHIVDAANPGNPKVVQRIPTTQMGGVSAGPVFAIGNLLVVTTPKATAGIATLDISDPLDPVLLDVVRPSPSSYIGWFYGTNTYLQSPLRTYDVTSNPSNIKLLGSAPTPRSEYMSFADDYLFLGGVRRNIGGNNGIYKIDISNPNRAPVIGRIAGRNNNAIDDQFSLPVGNLVVVGDDEIRVGSFIAVHQAAPDTRAPEVLYVNPPKGAREQSVTSRIGLSFSDQIELTSVRPSSLIVRPLNRAGNALTGIWGLSHTMLNFWPDQPLQKGTTYEIVVPAGGVTDLVGNPIRNPFRSQFTTQGAADPLVCEITPPQAIQMGRSVRFQADLFVSNTLRYRWNFGDGKSGAGASVAHTYPNAGRYTVQLTVEDPQQNRQISCSALQIVHKPLTRDRPTRSRRILLDETQQKVWATNPDANTVTAVDAKTHRKLFEVAVGQSPQTLAQAPDGTIWVVNQGSFDIHVLHPDNGRRLKLIRLPYASQPFGIAFTPDGAAAFVTLQALGQVVKLNPASRSIIKTLQLNTGDPSMTPQVRGIAITEDSNRVFVTRFISPNTHGEVFEIRASNLALTDTLTLANDIGPDAEDNSRGIPNYLSSITISPDGARAWIPSKKDNLDRGLVRDGRALTHDTSVRTIVSQLDLRQHREVFNARIDLNNQEMATAAEFSPIGDVVFVVTQGTNLINAINAYNGSPFAGFNTGLAPQDLVLSTRTEVLNHFLGNVP